MTYRVYAIAWSLRGPTKIGVSDRLISRLTQLQSGNPYRLRIYGAITVASEEIARQIEAGVLSDLAGFRLVGEWLKLTPVVVKQAAWHKAKKFDRAAIWWKPTAEQRNNRVINLRKFDLRRSESSHPPGRAGAALSDAKLLGINIK